MAENVNYAKSIEKNVLMGAFKLHFLICSRKITVAMKS